MPRVYDNDCSMVRYRNKIGFLDCCKDDDVCNDDNVTFVALYWAQAALDRGCESNEDVLRIMECYNAAGFANKVTRKRM